MDYLIKITRELDLYKMDEFIRYLTQANEDSGAWNAMKFTESGLAILVGNDRRRHGEGILSNMNEAEKRIRAREMISVNLISFTNNRDLKQHVLYSLSHYKNR